MVEIVYALRSELETAVGRIRAFEAAVTAAQERLRTETDKAEKLKALLAVYEGEEQTETTAEQAQLPIPPPHALHTDQPRQASTKKARMEQEIIALLSLRGSLHRSAILEHLNAKGIMGGEKDQLAHLAAFLSDNRAKFASDGRGTYSLRRNEPSPAPNGAGSAGMERTPSGDAHP
jgi:hypothetical protein